MTRELFFVLSDGVAWRSAPFQLPTGYTLREAVKLNALAYNVQRDETDQLSADPDAYDLFSWHLQSLPSAARVAQVPRPGVVLAVERGTPERMGLVEQGTAAVAMWMRRELDGDEGQVAQRFSGYLDTPAPRWSPAPLAERDLLVSHHPDDALIVADLTETLEAADLTCLALERPDGAAWTLGEAWRHALDSSAVLVSVVGPSSLEGAAVFREAGAAWALGRAIVPALVGVPPDRLPSLMSSYQVRKIETPAHRAALADELHEFMGGAAGGTTD